CFLEDGGRFPAGVLFHLVSFGWGAGEDGGGPGRLDRGAPFPAGPAPRRGGWAVRGVAYPTGDSGSEEAAVERAGGTDRRLFGDVVSAAAPLRGPRRSPIPTRRMGPRGGV